MLEARELTKSLASVPAVEDVSFLLSPGQVLGCLGPNGSGKSTTVKMLTGLLEPTRGKVLFHGHNIQEDPVGFRKCLVTLWSLLLTEIMLLGFRKIPFTCSYPPFRDSAVVVTLSYVLGFFVFVLLTSNLEYWGLSNPILMASLIAIVLIAWYVLSRFQQEGEEIGNELIFEDNAPASFELLDLGRGS